MLILNKHYQSIQTYNNNKFLYSQEEGMSSANVEENSVLKYVVFCFSVWGVRYLTKDILKKAKDNSPQCCEILTRAIFDLQILQIVQFEYTIDDLAIDTQLDVEFVQQFVLSYLSQANCPFLAAYNSNQHALDFTQSRILLLILGWLMAKSSFFSKLKSKIIDKKYTALYIDKSVSFKKSKEQKKMIRKQKRLKSYENLQNSPETIQRLYRVLSQHQFRIQCLQSKKSKIYMRLNKEISQFNKKNQTNFKIEQILNESAKDDQIQEQQEILEAIIRQANAGMKNQQYFWMWLQSKVVQSQYAYLKNNFEQFQKVDPPPSRQAGKMNHQYLSMYNKQYKYLCSRMEEINNHFSSIQHFLDAKPPKNESSIAKQVAHETNKILYQQRKELVQQLGNPCFLKLEVIKFLQKKGFGVRNRKNKRSRNQKQVRIQSNDAKVKLKEEITDFIGKLDQIKFI